MARAVGSRNIPLATNTTPPDNLVFRDFDGINTEGGRQAIGQKQFSWLENVMPLGFADLKAVPQISAVLATIPASRVIYYRKEYNIGGTNYLFIACTDGSAWQVLAESPWTVTAIAAAGTFSGTSTQTAQWKNERVLIIDPTGGYRDWNGSVLTNLSGVSGSPSNGTLIATYSGRVWICTGTTPSRTIAYSDVTDYTDFTGAGGSTTITDETLISSIQQFMVANNFLYFFGVDSVNVIADVQVVGGVTQFSNTNLVANSGSNFPQSVIAYFRSIWYMDNSGIYALYGAVPRKVSDALDGIFRRINFDNPVTAGTVTLYNKLCICYNVTYDDPVEGERQIMLIYFGKKWFVASQSVEVNGIATSHGGADELFGTLGSDVYQVFSDMEAEIDQTIQSRLWDFDDFISIKQAMQFGCEMILTGGQGSIDVTVDTERFAQAPSVTLGGSFEFVWYNSVGDSFSWDNSLGADFTWLVSGYIWFQGNVEVQGHYLGFTVTSVEPQANYQGMQMQFRKLPAGWGV